MSELLSFEKFLVMNGIKQKTTDDTIYDRLLLKEYNSRFLDKLFNIKSKKVSQEYRNRKTDQEYFDLWEDSKVRILHFTIQIGNEECPEHLISKTEYDLELHPLHLLESDISDLNVNSASFNLNLDKEVCLNLCIV
ncbi:MAG: hypothetical protein IPH77_15845 [Ignavibacteria bacterium]|nr:hypothetical protein [Ignavibacteria bacterium]